MLLAFALGVYELQARSGRYFLHEHLASASSRGLDEVKAAQHMDGMAIVTGDACMFDMKPVDAEGAERPAKKPPRWMSSAPQLSRSPGPPLRREACAY